MILKLSMKNKSIIVLATFIIANPFQIFANDYEISDSNNANFLTYEDAVKMAIKESTEIKNSQLEKESNSKKISESKDSLGDSLYDPQLLALMKIQKQESINNEKTDRLEDYIKQVLTFKIKSIFNDINLMKSEIELKKEQLSNSTKKRDILALKVEHGMESKTNLTTKDIEIKQSKKDIESLENDLEKKYIELNKLIGKDSFERYEIERLSFKYTPIKDTKEDIEFKATRAVNSDMSIWGKKQELEIQSIDVDFYSLNYVNGLRGDKQLSSPSAPYKSLELDSQITSNSLEQDKADLRNTVIDKYNTIKNIETMHESTSLKLKDLEEKKRVLETAIKVGTIIKQDYEDVMLGLKEVNFGIEEIESKHELLVELYNNPLLAGSGTN